MKKSTDQSPTAPASVLAADANTPAAPAAKPVRPLFWELLLGEGGVSLLIILPLVVIFFLKKAFE